MCSNCAALTVILKNCTVAKIADNDLENNFENNPWNLKHNAENLQEILNRIMQSVMSIITSFLVTTTTKLLPAKVIIIIIIDTGQTTYADKPRGRSIPQKELNNTHTQTIINRLGYIVC